MEGVGFYDFEIHSSTCTCIWLREMVLGLSNKFLSTFCIAGAEMTELSDKLNYDREVIRVWFCNKRQALKNTIKKLKQETP